MTFRHLDDVLAEVEWLGRMFASAGHRLFLVGGIVRDQWLDEPLDTSSDIDLTTDAHPARIKELIGPSADDLWGQGERFGTIGMRSGGRDYEITTHRAESYESDSRKPDVTFGDKIEVDLSRRDFTVNAMAIELPDGGLIDPWGGADDLDRRVLRTPLSADSSFRDDPLRMLRAARFASKLGLTVAPDVTRSATELRERVRIVAIERIGIEMSRMLSLRDPSAGLEFLTETGLLAEVIWYGRPESIEQADAAVLADAAGRAAGLLPDWRLRIAALGMTVLDGADEVGQMCRRLRLSRDDERHIVGIARAARAIVDAESVDPETIRRWAASTHDGPGSIALAEAIADDRAGVARFRAAEARLSAAEPLGEIELLDGQVIMRTLGVDSGPVIGEAVDFLRDRYFTNGPMAEATQLECLRSWWSDRATNA